MVVVGCCWWLLLLLVVGGWGEQGPHIKCTVQYIAEMRYLQLWNNICHGI